MTELHHKSDCQSCSLHPLCLPLTLNEEDLGRFDDIVHRGQPLQRGEVLYRQGDAFSSVFAVRSGALKTFVDAPNGDEQVAGFHLPSEIVGLENIGSDTYSATAIALETTHLCEIPVQHLDALSGQLPALRQQLFRLMGKELRADQQRYALLSKKAADERMASFLINLLARNHRRKLSVAQLWLPMARADIANHLGLAVETVSRILTRFQKQGLISTGERIKDIVIDDLDGLLELAEMADCERIELGLPRD